MTPAEPRWRTALLTWLAIYPTITIVGAAAAPLTSHLPWALRSFVLTVIMVPLVVYVTGPLARAAVAVLGRATARQRR